MREKRKIFRLLLCSLLCFALLGGCGQAPAEVFPETAESLTPAPASSAAEKETESEAPLPESTAAATLPAETGEVPETAPSGKETLPESTAVPTTPFVSQTRADGARTVLINGSVFWVKDHRAVEPESSLPIESMRFSDFGPCFEESFPVTRESYRLCPGQAVQTEVWHIHSEQPGPVIYLVAGTHGDERAGWYAGLLLREATISCGDLYVLSVANVQGAAAGRRYVTGKQDLNRSYPGSADTEAGRLAAAILADIREKAPEFVFDLHEAIVVQEERDFLGSSLIFTSLTVTKEFGDLFFDLLDAIDEGKICFEPFAYNGPAPNGSLNNTVTNELKIPILTVETFRGYPIEHRVEEQLEIVEYVLALKGMR